MRSWRNRWNWCGCCSSRLGAVAGFRSEETLFLHSVSKHYSDWLRGKLSAPTGEERKIPCTYLVRQMSLLAMGRGISVEAPGAGVQRQPDNVSSCQITCLVTMGRAFYNPPNTALDIVGMSTHRRVSGSRLDKSSSECLRNRFHFRISQEH